MPDIDTDSEMIGVYAAWVIRWRWLVLIAALGVAATAISGAPRLQLEGDYRYHFAANNPQLIAFEQIENTYTKVDNILFVLAPDGGNVFERETLQAVQWLTKQAWQIPYSIPVDSLTNFQHAVAEADDLSVADLIKGNAEFDPGYLRQRRDIALAEPSIVQKLVARDSGATAVNVTVHIPDSGGDEATPALYASDLAEDLRARYPRIKVAVTGSIPLIYAMMDTPQRDGMTLIPIMYLALLISTLLFLRSLWAVLGLLLMVGQATGTAMGAAG